MEHPTTGETAIGDEELTDVQVLMAEFREDPQAYMAKRAGALNGEVYYEQNYAQVRREVAAEQTEALRALGRRCLQLVVHPFSRREEPSHTTMS